ncbi:unnamed protein product [Euphydryas editha]|uniref:ATP synthase subunit b n=1 Tax=Euphydryas editha TaxID=104508 RepID=A0AAU9UW49_EUPED|nr:unnamed protein product [Euphydryas editha]
MLINRISKLGRLKSVLKICVISGHTETCPTQKKPAGSTASLTPTTTSTRSPGLKRALKSGKVRMGFIPEEWFLFFHSKTGVSGPYVFGIVVINYLLSKEIYVMEHEYYTGLSIFPLLYFISTRFGPDLARTLDKDVDEYVNMLEKGRKDELDGYEKLIKDSKDAQWRAEGQKVLMDAKKENIDMQLEAAYRERYMQVYRAVKGRLDYHVKFQRVQNRIHQKWMINWIIANVRKSITPEFEKEVLRKAIQDIAVITGKI